MSSEENIIGKFKMNKNQIFVVKVAKERIYSVELFRNILKNGKKWKLFNCIGWKLFNKFNCLNVIHDKYIMLMKIY